METSGLKDAAIKGSGSGTGEAKYPKCSDPFPPLLSAPQSVGWVLTVFFFPADLIFSPLGCWEL